MYNGSWRNFRSLLGRLRVQIQGNHIVRVGLLYLQKMRLELTEPLNEVLADESDGARACYV